MEWNTLFVIKWFKIHKNIYFGLFSLGLFFFLFQEIPYIIMPLVELANNPLMEMIDTYPILNLFEKIFGISTIIAMIFIVNSNTKGLNLDFLKEKIFFTISIILLLGYYLGWMFYFNGYQELSLVLIVLAGFPPLYYTFIGLWRKNHILVPLGILFLIFHLANVWTSY
ncbi:MAG: hypothetical protein FWH29_00120 [Methanobrevibacter sp.]|nr:hypothetical protein [Methanobrevibacter sp.]